MEQPQRTFLYDQHVALGARMVDFAGWLLPVQYEGILAEHKHCRAEAVIFDTCHMGQFLITGPDAAAKLAGALTQDTVKLPVGRGKYGFILNDAGGVIDDTIIMRLADDEFLLVVNATTAAGDLKALQARLGGETQITVQASWGKLDIQGPRSFDVLQGLVETDLSQMRYFGCCRTRAGGVDCILSRTGYTGELGYEIFMPGQKLAELTRTILANPLVKPAGLGSRDSLRLEMGYPLYGHELSDEINPVEAGLGFFFDIERNFHGADALRKFTAAVTPTAQVANLCHHRQLVALLSDQRRRFNTGDAILCDGQVVGEVTSGVFSPSLERVVGMGYVQPGKSAAGQELAVQTARAELPVVVSETPMYPDGTCRMKLHEM
ncbi:MAG: glycine cleavage system aminomethyltransferase GcvT [Phycisphaerae bacterium]|nr:glycine cleavage system aminomethyltransferase GcvT [Phycisphaerae bacterium]